MEHWNPNDRIRRVSSWAWLAGALAGWLAAAGEAVAKVNLEVPLLLTQSPREGNAPAANWDPAALGRADGFEGARVVVVSPAGEVRVLSEGFAAACDPGLSCDAQRVLFAGKRAKGDRWRIWEIGLEGQGLRAVSPADQDARSPIYATTLFTLDSPEPWFTVVYVANEAAVNEAGTVGVSSLYNVKLDGSELRRLTYIPNRVFDPFQMWDGRVLYAAERYPVVPAGPKGRVGLYSSHIVGTETVSYGGEGGRRIQHMPCATEGRLVVFVESDQAEWDGAGQLACLREQRPHASYRSLTSDPAWRFLYPSPWRTNQVLVSRRPANGPGTAAICAFDAASGTCEAVFEDAAYHCVQAVAVQRRTSPDGHSTVVDPDHYQTGIFYGMNCYDADEALRPHLKPGMLKKLRVVEGATVPPLEENLRKGTKAEPVLGGRQGPYVARRILGEAPIESDGSFQVEVPADTPVLLQALDERGLALATCGWVWVKPREARGCVGCHEDPEWAPENQFVLALRRPASPAKPPVAERRSIGFRDTVAPLLKRRCASTGCHGVPDSPLYLPLMGSQPGAQDLQQAFASLRANVDGGPSGPGPTPQSGKYVDPGRARTSPLIWRVFGRDTSRPWDPRAGGAKNLRLMPPADKGGPLSEEELRILVEWIDTGAAWEATKGATAPVAQTKEAGHP